MEFMNREIKFWNSTSLYELFRIWYDFQLHICSVLLDFSLAIHFPQLMV